MSRNSTVKLEGGEPFAAQEECETWKRSFERKSLIGIYRLLVVGGGKNS
jgi:hypothetical protein